MATRVMVVDDSRTSRRILKGVLQELGYEVCGEAKNGEEAFQMYGECNPDIVTMDITMPVLNGVEALLLLKKKYPDCKVIMVSAAGQKHIMLDAIKAGASEFILKPFDVTAIKNAIEKALNEEGE